MTKNFRHEKCGKAAVLDELPMKIFLSIYPPRLHTPFNERRFNVDSTLRRWIKVGSKLYVRCANY